MSIAGGLPRLRHMTLGRKFTLVLPPGDGDGGAEVPPCLLDYLDAVRWYPELLQGLYHSFSVVPLKQDLALLEPASAR